MTLVDVRLGSVLALACLLIISSCRSDTARSGNESDQVEAPAVTADADDAAAVEPEIDPAPQPLQVEAVAVLDDQAIELKPEASTEGVPAESRFQVLLPAISDVRVRLFDEGDRLVPSNDRLDIVGERARYVIEPAAPLVSGSRYVLLIDGQRAELPSDALGRQFEEVRIEFKTSGEKPQPQPAKSNSRTRKRRR